jgi:hypothetical protein
MSSSSPSFAQQDEVLRDITEAVRRVNEAVRQAVEAGVSVELMRASRCHDGCGNWGDQMVTRIQD